MFDRLMNTDISAVDWRNDRPVTSFYEDMREVSLDKEMAFLSDWITTEHHKSKGGVVSRDAKSLFEEFRMSLFENYTTNPVKFGIKIKNYNIGGLKPVRSHGILKYEVDTKAAVASLIVKGVLRANWTA